MTDDELRSRDLDPDGVRVFGSTPREPIEIRKISPACNCDLCDSAGNLEIESHTGTWVFCVDCARQLGHASIGNRTWKP